jgi:Spy/CpxP family protein refolding chaperone
MAPLTMMCGEQLRRKNMNQYIRPIAAALCFGVFMLMAMTSSAQQKGAKLEAIAQQLNLTPEQKAKVLPILADEAPKVKAIKEDHSFSRIQKMQRIKAIHQQTDPQMKAILSPEQYQKLQAIRHQALADAIH